MNGFAMYEMESSWRAGGKIQVASRLAHLGGEGAEGADLAVLRYPFDLPEGATASVSFKTGHTKTITTAVMAGLDTDCNA